jgi:hypothetical protein
MFNRAMEDSKMRWTNIWIQMNVSPSVVVYVVVNLILLVRLPPLTHPNYNNPLVAWQFDNNHLKFPTLARMARDIHSISATIVGVERQFYLARCCNEFNRRYNRRTFEALLLVKAYLSRDEYRDYDDDPTVDMLTEADSKLEHDVRRTHTTALLHTRGIDREDPLISDTEGDGTGETFENESDSIADSNPDYIMASPLLQQVQPSMQSSDRSRRLKSALGNTQSKPLSPLPQRKRQPSKKVLEAQQDMLQQKRQSRKSLRTLLSNTQDQQLLPVPASARNFTDQGRASSTQQMFDELPALQGTSQLISLENQSENELSRSNNSSALGNGHKRKRSLAMEEEISQKRVD